jgi:hypothetical protein
MRSGPLILLTMLLSFVAGQASASHEKIEFDNNNLLYTGDLRAYQQAGVEPLFEDLLRGQRPVVLFIHGRGTEPRKSLQGTGIVLRRFHVDGQAVKKLVHMAHLWFCSVGIREEVRVDAIVRGLWETWQKQRADSRLFCKSFTEPLRLREHQELRQRLLLYLPTAWARLCFKHTSG